MRFAISRKIAERADDAESDEPLRKQLQDACESVRNQIDVLNRSRYSRAGGYGGDDLALARLDETLERLEAALADLGPEGA